MRRRRRRRRHRTKKGCRRRITDCSRSERRPRKHIISHKRRSCGSRRVKKRLRRCNRPDTGRRWQRDGRVRAEIAKRAIKRAIGNGHAQITRNVITFLRDLHARNDRLVSEAGASVFISRTLVYQLTRRLNYKTKFDEKNAPFTCNVAYVRVMWHARHNNTIRLTFEPSVDSNAYSSYFWLIESSQGGIHLGISCSTRCRDESFVRKKVIETISNNVRKKTRKSSTKRANAIRFVRFFARYKVKYTRRYLRFTRM